MKSLVASTIIALFATSANAANPHDPNKTNPALSYWQAAAELPELSDAQAKSLREVADGNTAFTAEVLDGLDFSNAQSFLRKAAASGAECDWGLAWEDGAEMVVPHLSKMRELSTVTIVLAEEQFAAGETAAGIDLLMDAHHLARDAGASDNLIGNLVQNASERRAFQTAARHCMAWEAAWRRDYAQRLKALPALHPLHKAYEHESILVDWFEKRLDENLEETTEELGIPTDGANGIEFVEKMIAGQREMHAKAVAILKLAGDERRAAAAELEKEIGATKNLLVAIIMPAISGFIKKDDQVAVARSMLELALEHGAEISQQDLEGTGFKLERKDGAVKLSSDKPEFFLEFGNP